MNIIKLQRNAMKITQSEMAKRVGISRVRYNQLEKNGFEGASVSLLKRICNELGLELMISGGRL